MEEKVEKRLKRDSLGGALLTPVTGKQRHEEEDDSDGDDGGDDDYDDDDDDDDGSGGGCDGVTMMEGDKESTAVTRRNEYFPVTMQN